MAKHGIVYVIDDDPDICALIEATLRPEGLEVRSFLTAELFAQVELQEQDGPGCILLDLVMPGMSGIEYLETFFKRNAFCPVIMISARGSIGAAVKSIKLGAVDFLEKPFSPEVLKGLVLQTIQRHRQEIALSNERAETRRRLATLSPRERELLNAIVQGESTKMVADRLKISARTVDHHRANLMQKMNASNVADLVRMTIKADHKE